MVESLLGNLMGQRFKSQHRQTGLLYNKIPLDLIKIELAQILQASGALVSTVTLQRGAHL